MPDLRIVLIRNVRAASQCSACGTDQHIEFHHIRTKRFALGDHAIVRRVPLDVVIDEMERCIPLCHTCHTHLHQNELCVNLEQSSRTHLAVVRTAKIMLGAKSSRRPLQSAGKNRNRRRKPKKP